MDELALMYVPGFSTGSSCSLLIEQVSVIRGEIIKGKNWKKCCEKQISTIFSLVTDSNDAVLRKISEVYTMEGVENILASNHVSDLQPTSSQTITGIQLVVKVEDEIICKMDGLQTDPMFLEETQTPDRPFQRRKVDLSKYSIKKLQIPPNSFFEVNITFEAPAPLFTGAIDILNLPTNDSTNLLKDSETFEVSNSLPLIIWKQIGSLKEKLVLQICFKRMNVGYKVGNQITCYKLQSIFVSQPLLNV